MYQEILDRLAGDATLTGLLGAASDGIFNTVAPAETPYPIVTYNLVDASIADAFGTRTHLVRFEVHSYVEEESGTIPDAYARNASIQQQIIGNWDTQSSRVPTFGLDRWTPTLTGWSASQVEFQSAVEANETGMIHTIYSFQVYVSK